VRVELHVEGPRRGNFKFAVSSSAGRLLATRQVLSYFTRVTKNFYIRPRCALRRQLKYLGGIVARLCSVSWHMSERTRKHASCE